MSSRVVVALDGSPVAEAVLRESRLPVFLMRVTEAQVAGRAAQVAVK